MGGILTTTQFYFYGRSHFTQTGWFQHSAKYAPSIAISLEASELLREKVFIVTGANNGIGKELTKYLYNNGAKVWMFCRDKKRAEEAKADILSTNGPHPESRLSICLCDCSLETDVRRAWREFEGSNDRLDGLVCNAGALLNKRTITEEGIEVTFASHLLLGSYLLGTLAMPKLKSTQGRLILVSSGGMYNHKFPSWDVATSSGPKAASHYDGQMAYVYAKRGQILLAERWAQMYPEVKTVSCHPGWVDTPGVDKAYGANKSYLSPLRTLWQGTEGIAWLCAAPATDLQSGAFYLDRSPQFKHISGCFFTEGSYTLNTEEEVDDVMSKLETWSDATRRNGQDGGS